MAETDGGRLTTRSKERPVADKAKSVLMIMNEWKVPLTPENYHVWFDYVTGTNEELRQAIDAQMASGRPFTEEVNDDLYYRFLGKQQHQIQLQLAQHETHAILKSVIDEVLSSNDISSEYADKLRTYSAQLQEARNSEDLRELIGELIKETDQMAETSQQLQEQLSSTTNNARQLLQRLEKVDDKSLRDTLTGLNNKKGFNRKFHDLETAHREDRHPFSLILFDLDEFVKINDSYGRNIGDEVLKLVARELLESIKGKDTPSRVDGEEFAILLPETALEGANFLANRLCGNIAHKKFRNKKTNQELAPITASFGVAEFRDGDSIDSLVQRAQQAVALAKKSGRNTVRSENDLSGS